MSLKEDIDLLESKIARLKVEYEQYFMRVLKREPLKLRDEIEKLLLSYSNKSISNTSLKFKYNSIVAKYNSYKQYWTRVLREIEEGTYARKSEGAAGTALKSEPKSSSVFGNGVVREKPPAAAKEEGGVDGGLKELYEKYTEARRECNEPPVPYEALQKTVDQYKKKVEELYKTSDVDFKVYIKDGKAKLAITPKK